MHDGNSRSPALLRHTGRNPCAGQTGLLEEAASRNEMAVAERRVWSERVMVMRKVMRKVMLMRKVMRMQPHQPTENVQNSSLSKPV